MKPATLIYRYILGLAIWLFMMAGCAHALTPQQLPLPAQGQAIVDEAGLLSAEEKTHLNQTIQAHRQAFGDEIVVVLLPSLVDPTNANALPAQDFATELFNHWHIGQASENNGLLVLVVADQRRIEFTTGYGLEGILPDAVCWNIEQKYMLGAFQQHDYAGGLSAGLNQVIGLLEQYPAPRTGQAPSYTTPQVIGMGLNAPFTHATPYYLAEGGQTYWFYAARFVSFWLISQILWFGIILLKQHIRHLTLRRQRPAPTIVQLNSPNGQWLYATLTTALPIALALYGFFDSDDVWQWLQQCLFIMLMLIGVLACYAAWLAVRMRGQIQLGSPAGDHQRHQEYRHTESLRYIALFFLSPLLLWPYEAWYRKHIPALRTRVKTCTQCHAPLERLNGARATEQLSAQQQAYIQYDFADFDVWRCATCGHTEVLGYPAATPNPATLTVCPHCHEQTSFVSRTRTIQTSTAQEHGQAEETHQCLNCQQSTTVAITLPLLVLAQNQQSRDDDQRSDDSDSDSSRRSDANSSSDHTERDESTAQFGGGQSGGGGAGSNW